MLCSGGRGSFFLLQSRFLDASQVLELVLTLGEDGTLCAEQLRQASVAGSALGGEVLVVSKRPLAGNVVKVRRAPRVKPVLKVLEEGCAGSTKVLFELDEVLRNVSDRLACCFWRNLFGHWGCQSLCQNSSNLKGS